MKTTLKIGTASLINKLDQRYYNGVETSSVDNSSLIIDLITEQNIDILGTQNLGVFFAERLAAKLPKKYTITDNPKKIFVKNYFSLLPPITEFNSIITSKEVLDSRIIPLPFMNGIYKEKTMDTISDNPFTLKRVTQSVIDTKTHGKISFLNVELNDSIPSLKIRQLKKIRELVVKSFYPTIITGNFYADIEQSYFKEFVECLDNLGISRTEINQQTSSNHHNLLATDHIFIPKEFQIEETRVITGKKFDTLTDHYPVIVKIK